MTRTELCSQGGVGAGGRRHVVAKEQQPVIVAAVLDSISHFNSLPSYPIWVQQASASQERNSQSAQRKLTPRPFRNCPAMMAGAQSNWTLTVTNGRFASAQRCNVPLNERKHAHQFHAVATTILLWVIVGGGGGGGCNSHSRCDSSLRDLQWLHPWAS